MGCGTSQPASESTEAKPTEKKATENQDVQPAEGVAVADRLEGAAEMAAAGALAGAMASAAATAVVNSDATLQSAPEELAKATGEALLEMAKTVPFVAPVAYLIGAIASSAVTAVTLKADCVEFGKIVQMLENILLKAQNLESHEEVVQDVKESLEEALMLMEKMQDRGIIAATFLAKSDKSRFEDLRVRIEQAINRLNLSVTVDTAVITKAKFQQSEELRKKIEDLGGLDVVESDPDAAKQLQDMMEASDQVLNANIVAARKSLKVVGDEVMKANSVMKTIEEQQRDHMRETRKSIQNQEEESKKLQELTTKMKEEHGSKLDEMTENFMKVQQQAELQKLQNEVLKQQVDELKTMLSEVKDCMTKFPVPPREPERLLLAQTGGLLSMKKEDKSQMVIDEACKEIMDRWGLATAVNVADKFTLECKGGYFPTEMASFESASPQEMQSTWKNMCGFSCARRASPCAHVIASENTVCYSGQNDKPEKLLHKPEEAAALARHDPALASQLKLMQSIQEGKASGTFFDSLEEYDEETKEKMQSCLMGYMMAPTTFYCGCPIKVEGITVASLCCFGIREPEGWCDKDVKAVEAIGIRVGHALEKEAQAKKFQNAQAAMMQQMMFMQQQMMMGMGMQMGAGAGAAGGAGMMSQGMVAPQMMPQMMQMMGMGVPAQ